MGAINFKLTISGKDSHISKRLEGESSLEHYFSIHDAIIREDLQMNDPNSLHPLLKHVELPYTTNVYSIRGGFNHNAVMVLF